MAKRISAKELESIVRSVNTFLGTPTEPYDRENAFRPNVGCYHLDAAYDGYRLDQMTACGLRCDVLCTGYVRPGILAAAIVAFKAGLAAGVRAQ